MKKDGEREGKREEGREKEIFQDSLVLKSIKIVCMFKLNVIFLEKNKMKTGHIFYIWFFLVALLFTFCSILLKILTFQVVNFVTIFLWLKKRSDHFIFKRPFKWYVTLFWWGGGGSAGARHYHQMTHGGGSWSTKMSQDIFVSILN